MSTQGTETYEQSFRAVELERRIAANNVDDVHELFAELALLRDRFRAPLLAQLLKRKELHVAAKAARHLADLGDTLPRCARCGGLRRPDVVLFGESLDGASLARAQSMAADADACLVIGTSAEVYPAAAIPWTTRHAGGHIIEVNTQATSLTGAASVAVHGKAGEVLPEMLG